MGNENTGGEEEKTEQRWWPRMSGSEATVAPKWRWPMAKWAAEVIVKRL